MSAGHLRRRRSESREGRFAAACHLWPLWTVAAAAAGDVDVAAVENDAVAAVAAVMVVVAVVDSAAAGVVESVAAGPLAVGSTGVGPGTVAGKDLGC